MMQKRFVVRLDEDAVKEYKQLNGSILSAVNNAIDELVCRADEIGKSLRNNSNTKLAGCKEIKLRAAGIRIVFRLTNEIVDVLYIVHVLTIERLTSYKVRKIADSRLRTYKAIPIEQLKKNLASSKQWKNKRP